MGAGPVANARFVQFELVTARNQAEFAASINNAAWYTAYLAHQYQIPLTLASQHYGIGGIWQHADVTRYLGGTDHSDPTGYLKQWHYTLNEFLDLVKAYARTQTFLDTILSQKSTNYAGLVSENGRTDALYSGAPWNINGAKWAANINIYDGQAFQVVAEATTQSASWVKLRTPKGDLWVDKRAIKKYDRVKSQTNVNYPAKFVQIKRNDGLYNNGPYNTVGATKYGSAKSLDGQTTTVSAEAVITVQKVTWAKVTLANGRQVWIDKAGIHQYQSMTNRHAVSYQAAIENVTADDGLFLDQPDNVIGSSKFASATDYQNQEVKALQEASVGKETWAQIQLRNGKLVWIKKTGLMTYGTLTNLKKVDQYQQLKGTTKTDFLYLNQPYGVKGSTKYAKASVYENTAVRVLQSGTVNNEQWAQVILKNKQTVWIQARLLKVYPELKVTMTQQYTAKVGKAKSTDNLYSPTPWSTYGAKVFGHVAAHAGQTVTVLQEGAVGKVVWAQIKFGNGKQAWIDRKFLTVSSQPDDRYITVTQRYDVYSNFSFKKRSATTFGNTYHVTRKYYNANGNTYLSLYRSNGSWVGYINQKAVTEASIDGAWQPATGYVTFANDRTNAYTSLMHTAVRTDGTRLSGHTYKVTGLYRAFSGKVQYSLSATNGQWLGYIDASAVKLSTNPQGQWVAHQGYFTTTVKGKMIWSGFDFHRGVSTSSCYQDTYKINGAYHHVNGATYYSLYDHAGKWMGYISSADGGEATDAGGAWINANQHVQIVDHQATVWSSIGVKQISTTAALTAPSYQASGKYHHFDGTWYTSLYLDGKWQGYVSQKALKVK